MKTDPDQLDVTPQMIKRLKKIHRSTISEYDDGTGPVAWLLLIPTTNDLMVRFLDNKINEKELFNLTPLNIKYEALYLCSAPVLEEYRRKGIIKQLALNIIENMKIGLSLRSLFAWLFINEGNEACQSIARLTSLPLYMRHEKK